MEFYNIGKSKKEKSCLNQYWILIKLYYKISLVSGIQKPIQNLPSHKGFLYYQSVGYLDM
ncbi:hypothetical protein [Metabacillus dongyingensis]|uniref:hypothetical protein n=1 Tax=Metabacillus dongyingensis TaxID=2874282 RepID=UPI001CBE9D3E|nr:hypothetical protein [Metabacillus dongyingensis]UAL52968.1 hypothetical protein K8L98_03915 [Metabacillus dongyingensis]